MSGKVVTVLPKTTLDFTNAGFPNGTIPLGHPIDTLEYIEATLNVRVHSVSGGSGSVNISFYVDGWFQGTNQDFLGDALQYYNYLITISPSTVAPTLLLSKAGAVPGRYITVGAYADQGLKVTISIDVC